jgi:predicted SAM-dependent methyltransferase
VTVADAGGDEVAFDDGFFDLVLLSHVLEHFPSPTECPAPIEILDFLPPSWKARLFAVPAPTVRS